MRLIKPSPGELADRQSILELKLDYGMPELLETSKVEYSTKGIRGMERRTIPEPTKVNIIPFKEELEAVIDYTAKHWVPGITDDDSKVQEYDSLYDQLCEVNATLWQLEDQGRSLRKSPDALVASSDTRLGQIYREVMANNDKRAGIVQQINALWGINHQEKFYSKEE